MKKLVFAAMAACSFMALAQAPEGAAEGPRPHRGAMAARGGMPRGGMPSAIPGDAAVMAVMNPKVAEKIGVTKDVQERIRKIDRESREKIRECQKKTREAMDNQAKLLKEAKPDEAAVMAAIDALFDLRKEMAKEQTRRVLSIKALLTPEQLEKALEEMKAQREDRRAKRRSAPKAPAEKPAEPQGEQPAGS